MNRICLLLIDDGREDYLQRTVERLDTGFAHRLVKVHDDDHRLGFAGAIAQGWEQVLDTDCQWVFHVETDFAFNEDPPVRDMIALLERYPYLAQVALKRQPCNPEETAAGGIVEQHPDDFRERRDSDYVWTEHRRFWTTNPSVYHRRYCEIGWPQEQHSEGKFTHKLLADPLLRFAFWGGKYDPPRVEHQGVRCGVGY